MAAMQVTARGTLVLRMHPCLHGPNTTEEKTEDFVGHQSDT